MSDKRKSHEQTLYLRLTGTVRGLSVRYAIGSLEQYARLDSTVHCTLLNLNPKYEFNTTH